MGDAEIPEHVGDIDGKDDDVDDGNGFKVQSKEELFYLRKLAEAIDVSRVPHLRDRAWISFPVQQHLEKLKAHAHFSL
jgi:hypothetical protein